MPDAAELIKAIKRAAVEAVNASKPAAVCFGKVTSASPLKILVEQKMTLGEAQLILTRNVTEYKVEMTVEHFTEEAAAHRHEYKGKKIFTVHNGLVVGDEVILLRQQGGQKYIVADRLT